MRQINTTSREQPIKLPSVLAYVVGAELAPRSAVEALIEAAINALDDLDGDIDLLDTNDAEDEFALSVRASAWAEDAGAGCPIADDDHEHDGREPQQGI